MAYKDITPPEGGKITITDGKLQVPDNPVVPFIRGDGIGPDIWTASQLVFDAAIDKAYGGAKQIAWFEVFAGQSSKDKFDEWLPDDTVAAFREYLVGIKGPLTTPVGGGIRSINVALRQILDLYTCLRPVRWFEGVPSPVKQPELTDMVIFRENTEDIYAGIEFQHGTDDCDKFKQLFAEAFPERAEKIRFPDTVGIAPGGNINYDTGHAIFEATHGTAPKYAGLDKVNPGSVILSGEMMLRHLGWLEAADLIVKGMNGAIASRKVTYDFARLSDNATEINCSAFGQNIVDHMD